MGFRVGEGPAAAAGTRTRMWGRDNWSGSCDVNNEFRYRTYRRFNRSPSVVVSASSQLVAIAKARV
jgi:hypothetical protein